MKVDIITMHCPLNYGAVLQAYALQTYIHHLGHEVDIIDYRPYYIVYDQSLLFVANKRFNKSIILKLIYLLVKAPSKQKKIRIFKKFCNRYLSLSEKKYTDYKELTNTHPLADCYICGSDQIWGYSNNAYRDPAYFLGFVNQDTLKCSYAPSGMFPNPLPAEMKHQILPFINRLDFVSVREDSTRNLLQPYIKQKISTVVDPVFLLKKEEWISFSDLEKAVVPSIDYILIYAVGDSSLALEMATKLSEETGLPIYCISSSQKNLPNVSKKIMATPLGFLRLFKDAKYIVTNSFHGTAFSIIFEKEFWTCSTNIANNRLTSLLSIAGLKHRLLLNNANIDISNSKIDYSLTKSKIEKAVADSEEYLQSFLGNEK